MLVTQESTIATIELDGYTLSCEGIMCGDSWQFTMSFKNNILPSKTWTCDDFCVDDEDVENMMWAEVLRLTKKYYTVVFDKGTVEVEQEEYEDEN